MSPSALRRVGLRPLSVISIIAILVSIETVSARRQQAGAPSRVSDYTGFDFWLKKLNQFNGNYINAEMVKAFLASIEYRQRFGP